MEPLPKEVEIRSIRVGSSDLKVETRSGPEGKSETRLIGYAAKFGVDSQDLGWFKESIRQGAFTRALQEKQDVRALVDHNSTLILGRTKAGTLKLEQDEIGLRCEIYPLPDTQVARDLLENVRMGNVSQMSFGFIPRKQTWNDSGDYREIQDLDLFDVSVVTFPAYEQTEIEARSKAAWDSRPKPEPKHVPETLRARMKQYELETSI